MLQAKLFHDDPQTGGGGIKVPVGIHEGTVVFSGLSTDVSWTDINFTSNDGRVIHKRLFLPTGSRLLEGETIQDALDREVKQNLQHLVQVMTALLGKEVVDNFEAADYRSFVAQASAQLNPLKNTAVNLKVVPDYKEQKYPDLPRYGTYLEKHQPGVATSLKYSTKELEAVATMEKNRVGASSGATLENTEDVV